MRPFTAGLVWPCVPSISISTCTYCNPNLSVLVAVRVFCPAASGSQIIRSDAIDKMWRFRHSDLTWRAMMRRSDSHILCLQSGYICGSCTAQHTSGQIASIRLCDLRVPVVLCKDRAMWCWTFRTADPLWRCRRPICSRCSQCSRCKP